MKTVAVEEARKTLGALVTEVASTAEAVTVTKNGIPAAVLSPVVPQDPGFCHLHLRVPQELVEDAAAFTGWWATLTADRMRSRALAARK